MAFCKACRKAGKITLMECYISTLTLATESTHATLFSRPMQNKRKTGNYLATLLCECLNSRQDHSTHVIVVYVNTESLYKVWNFQNEQAMRGMVMSCRRRCLIRPHPGSSQPMAIQVRIFKFPGQQKISTEFTFRLIFRIPDILILHIF